MSTNLLAYTQSLDGFDQVVRAMPSDAWDRPSPCAGWSGRDVVGHVVAVQRWIESLARETEPYPDPYMEPGRIADDDPVAVWAAPRGDGLDAGRPAGGLGAGGRHVPWPRADR